MSRFRERTVALLAAIVLPFAVRVLALPAVLRLCDRLPGAGRVRQAPNALVFRARRWLWHGRGPWTSTCLTRSLVLYAMLRQHGYRPHFVVGVMGAHARFAAHAWVMLDGVALGDPRGAVDGYSRLLSHAA
jgi:hypothetical protein